MTYLALYFIGIVAIWWVYLFGWSDALKKILSVLIPSILIILFNVKAGRLLFKSPLLAALSILPTAFFIYRASSPLVAGINSWIDKKTNDFVDSQDVVEAEVISREDL